MEGERFACLRMAEGELTGMQLELARSRARSVKRISHDGDTETFFMKGVES